jgi:uncharacterized protein YegP (UPF0339 family)
MGISRPAVARDTTSSRSAPFVHARCSPMAARVRRAAGFVLGGASTRAQPFASSARELACKPATEYCRICDRCKAAAKTRAKAANAKSRHLRHGSCHIRGLGSRKGRATSTRSISPLPTARRSSVARNGSHSGAVRGVAAVKENAVIDPRYERRDARDGTVYFVLNPGNGEIVGTGEMYSGSSARERGMESVKVNAPAAGVGGKRLTHIPRWRVRGVRRESVTKLLRGACASTAHAERVLLFNCSNVALLLRFGSRLASCNQLKCWASRSLKRYRTRPPLSPDCGFATGPAFAGSKASA